MLLVVVRFPELVTGNRLKIIIPYPGCKGNPGWENFRRDLLHCPFIY